ncbi:hypothetical protein Tco_0357563 [Tanacetum coccineum]
MKIYHDDSGSCLFGNKKKGVVPTNDVSNSNPFEILNSVDNDVEFGTNEGTTNLVNNGANSSEFSFMNVENSSTNTIPITDKIRKFEDLLIIRQAILVDETGNPLKNIKCPGDYDSENEVASVDNDMTRFMASERVGFSTQSLLEQWRDSYGNGDYDEDPYDDDMYEEEIKQGDVCHGDSYVEDAVEQISDTDLENRVGKVNFHTLVAPAGNRADVAILLESIRAISERFANKVYGFFVGKRVTFPVVDNYVKNTLRKYGIVN